jgi:hypothetical protein
VVNNPDLATPLGGVGGRYNMQGFEMSRVAGNYLGLSTGFTKPALPIANSNIEPVCTFDSVDVRCRTTTVINVLRNDYDPDGNNIYLTDAWFSNPADTAKAILTLNPADSTLTLTIRNTYNFQQDVAIYVSYAIKDNGIPASRCSQGEVKFMLRATASDFRLVPLVSKNDTVCIGSSTNLCFRAGCCVTNVTPSGLPAGVSLGWNTAHDTLCISGTPTASGTYNYTLTPNSLCQDSAVSGTIVVSSIQNLTGSISVSEDSICAGIPVTFTATANGNGATLAYQWILNNNPIPDANSTTYQYIPTNGDAVTCTVTTNARCPNPSSITPMPIVMKVKPRVKPKLTIKVRPR